MKKQKERKKKKEKTNKKSIRKKEKNEKSRFGRPCPNFLLFKINYLLLAQYTKSRIIEIA